METTKQSDIVRYKLSFYKVIDSFPFNNGRTMLHLENILNPKNTVKVYKEQVTFIN